jgi:hypothetical protein
VALRSLTLPSVAMPIELVGLLKLPIHSTVESTQELAEYIISKPTFRYLIQKSFHKYSATGSIDQILRNLGWKNFRNRLTSLYIYRLYHNDFPRESQIDYVRDILDFEMELEDLTVSGHSRSFLVGLYQKMVRIVYGSKDHSYASFRTPEEVFKLLSLGNAKAYRVDILLILIWQLSDILGFDKLTEMLNSEDADFDSILQNLSKEEGLLFTKNFLRYGYSINEIEIFTSELLWGKE